MRTFTESLFKNLNISSDSELDILLIENGISTVKSKCLQAHNNSIYLKSKILGDYLIARESKGKLKGTHPTPKVNIRKSIATWNDYPGLFEKVKGQDLYLAFSLNSFPEMSNSYFQSIESLFVDDETETFIVDFRRRFNRRDIDYMYKVLSEHKDEYDGNINRFRGIFLESTLYWLVEDAIRKINPEMIYVYGNVEQRCSIPAFNEQRKKDYTSSFEADALLLSLNQEYMINVLNEINNLSAVDIYFNEKGKEQVFVVE